MYSAVHHHPFACSSCPLTAPCRHCRAANMFNTHETLCCRRTTWMVSGFLPHIDPAIAKYPNDGGNSMSVCKVELMSQCSECLFEGWNETYADQLPMEFADGKIRLTHVVLLAPTPRLFVRPITAILGKVPMLRAGDTGTIPFSMRGYERTFYPGGKCDSAADKGDGSRLWYVNT